MTDILLISGLGLLTFAAGALAWCSLLRCKRQQRISADLIVSENQLRQQVSLLRQSVENMGEGLSAFDLKGRLLMFNARFAELLELPAEVLNRKSLKVILEFQTARGDFGPSGGEIPLDERFARLFQNLPITKERMTAAGRTLQIRRRAMPGGVVSLYSDITQLKDHERRMVQARNDAETANRAKSEFLANMSHELRTPLNAIVGFSEVVSGEVFGPMTDKKYLEYTKDIHSSGLHLLSIINDVLDMAKIESGKLQLSSECVEISKVIKDTLLMVRELAQTRNIKLAVSPPDEELLFVGDERALKQALLNIISNAVKFSRNGGRVDIRAGRGAENTLTLEVEDQGIGMSKEAAARVLQPFEQADPSTTRSHGGTGLGLPIAKGLAEALGGTLTLESCKGEGTRVRILLPALSSNGTRLEPDAAPDPFGATQAPRGADMQLFISG